MEFRERRRSRNNGGKRFSLDGRFRVGRGWLNASLTAGFETIIALRLRGITTRPRFCGHEIFMTRSRRKR